MAGAGAAVGAIQPTATHTQHTAADCGRRIMLIGTMVTGAILPGVRECMDIAVLTLLTAVDLAVDGPVGMR
jgi:hypothetical protein